MSTKTKAVKKPSVHPVYKDMVISVVKNSTRKGKSRIAIIKEIQENFSINSPQHEKHTKQCLKRLIDDGKLVKVKGLGVSGSFKLSKSCLESEGKKKRKSASAQKPAAKKPTTDSSTVAAASTTKKPAAPAKKPTPKKSPKKPAATKPKAKDAPKKKPTATIAASKPVAKTNKPAAKARKPPAKKPKTPKKAAQKKK